MSNVKTVLKNKTGLFPRCFIFQLFTHRCETQEVEAKAPNLILSTQNFSLSIQIRGPSFLRNELLPYLFLKETGWVGSFHLITCSLIVRILSKRSTYVYINISHVRNVVEIWLPTVSIQKLGSHSKNFSLQKKISHLFSKTNAVTKNSWSKNWCSNAGFTRNTPFFLGAKGRVRSRSTVKRLRGRL